MATTTKPKVVKTKKTSKKPTAKKSTTNKKGKKSANGSSPLRHVTSYLLWGVIGLVTLILSWFAIKLIIDNAFYIRAKFGHIVYPQGEVRGIDISHYQEDIDWDRLRNAELNGVPIRFIFVKATEGVDIIDENFNHNFYNAHRNGFVRGAYHFFSTMSNPVSQARHFCKVVQLEEHDIAPILDVEKEDGLTHDQLRKNVLKWMDYVENHYKVIPILYTSYSFRKYILNTPEFDKYPLWIAHYYVKELAYKGPWVFWQHSDKGRVDGIKTDVDLNVFNGTYEEMMKLTIGEEDDDDKPTDVQICEGLNG